MEDFYYRSILFHNGDIVQCKLKILYTSNSVEKSYFHLSSVEKTLLSLSPIQFHFLFLQHFIFTFTFVETVQPASFNKLTANFGWLQLSDTEF